MKIHVDIDLLTYHVLNTVILVVLGLLDHILRYCYTIVYGYINPIGTHSDRGRSELAVATAWQEAMEAV